ncbi:MAG: FIST N-terminal domain-containing protein [Planctomycetota bacterium]
MTHEPSETASEARIRFSAAISTRRDSAAAADEVCDRILADLSSTADPSRTSDLGIVHFTRDHARHAEAIERIIHERLRVETLIGVSASGVVGGAMQVRGAPGLSVMVGQLPGVSLHPFLLQDVPKAPERMTPGWARENIAPVVGLDRADAAGVLLFTDAFSVPLVRLMPSLSAARSSANIPILGGVASAGKAPGQNVLSLNGGFLHAGGIGVTLTGGIEIDCGVSQGCLGFGPTLLVTKCRGNVILELAGRRAVDVVREMVLDLAPEQRARLGWGLFVGRVINEYKDHFGRDDFLIRGIRGFDEDAGAVLTDDFFRVGQTIRLHYRDPGTAEADLGMVIDRARLRPAPAGALMITCEDRDAGAAGSPGQDAAALSRAFKLPAHGADAAKGGTAFSPDTQGSFPIAGFEAAGEIGPVGDDVFLHTQSAVVALFRGKH